MKTKEEPKAKASQLPRTTSFEIVKVDGDWKTANARWFAALDESAKIVNCIWQTWVAWHVKKNSRKKLKKWLDDYKNKGKKKAGKCPVVAMPSELGKLIYSTLTKEFPEVLVKVHPTLIQLAFKKLTGKSTRIPSLQMWTAILLLLDSPPSKNSQPIILDKQHSELVEPDKVGESFKLKFRITRIPIKGKLAKSVTDIATLRCRGRSVQSQVAILRKIASGECQYAGTSLVYSKSKKKWFAKISYKMPKPETPELDKSRVATLIPHAERPIHMILPARRRRDWIIGRGGPVAHTRRRIILQRRGRSESYRVASESRKGHGKKRALKDRQKFQYRWLHSVKTFNLAIARRAVTRCVENDIGTLVYFQPEGKFADSRYLSTAGKDERNDATSWQWRQLKTFLEQRCEEAGVTLVNARDVHGNGEAAT